MHLQIHLIDHLSIPSELTKYIIKMSYYYPSDFSNYSVINLIESPYLGAQISMY